MPEEFDSVPVKFGAEVDKMLCSLFAEVAETAGSMGDLTLQVEVPGKGTVTGQDHGNSSDVPPG